MKNDRVPLFVFVPGARGDFLANILHGDVLSTTWDQCAIDDRVQNTYCDKIHNFGKSEYSEAYATPATLSQWYSWCIWVNTDQEAWDVAWLNFNKHRNGADLSWQTVHSRYWLVKQLQGKYQGCVFDRMINYSDLWSVEFVHQLYQELHNKELTAQQLERIQHNIKINQELLTENPFSLYNTE
jgi:hypothetical protein